MYSDCIILKMHLILQKHLIDFALRSIFFFIVDQMLLLKVLN